MRQKVRLLLALAALVAAVPMVSACNTTEGAGKDLSNAGHGISNAAERNK